MLLVINYMKNKNINQIMLNFSSFFDSVAMIVLKFYVKEVFKEWEI